MKKKTGAMIRCGAKYIEDGEKSAKYFLYERELQENKDTKVKLWTKNKMP